MESISRETTYWAHRRVKLGLDDARTAGETRETDRTVNQQELHEEDSGEAGRDASDDQEEVEEALVVQKKDGTANNTSDEETSALVDTGEETLGSGAAASRSKLSSNLDGGRDNETRVDTLGGLEEVQEPETVLAGELVTEDTDDTGELGEHQEPVLSDRVHEGLGDEPDDDFGGDGGDLKGGDDKGADLLDILGKHRLVDGHGVGQETGRQDEENKEKEAGIREETNHGAAGIFDFGHGDLDGGILLLGLLILSVVTMLGFGTLRDGGDTSNNEEGEDRNTNSGDDNLEEFLGRLQVGGSRAQHGTSSMAEGTEETLVTELLLAEGRILRELNHDGRVSQGEEGRLEDPHQGHHQGGEDVLEEESLELPSHNLGQHQHGVEEARAAAGQENNSAVTASAISKRSPDHSSEEVDDLDGVDETGLGVVKLPALLKDKSEDTVGRVEGNSKAEIQSLRHEKPFFGEGLLGGGRDSVH